jgi:plasmid replication initiation protein
LGNELIKKDYVVEKRNVLNEMRAKGWTLQELRFFSIYLSRINARDISTRIVRFSLHDFQMIMGFKRVQANDLKPIIDNLLSKIVYMPLDNNGMNSGYTAFQLLKECTVYKDDNMEWQIEIDAHDKALPLMFEFKERYVKYHLKNVLYLKSVNQHRMYEVLKQYEHIGKRTFTYGELKEALGIEPDEYIDKATGKHRWDNFKTRVLDECMKVLAETTDICYTYEAERRSGLKKKITFTIRQNKDFKWHTTHELPVEEPKQASTGPFERQGADDAMEDIDEAETASQDDYFTREVYPFISEACENEFDPMEIQVLYNLIIKIIPHQSGKNRRTEMYDYLKRRYDELKWRAGRGDVKNRFRYIKKMIEADFKEAF